MKSKEFYRIVYDRVQLGDKLELPCVSQICNGSPGVYCRGRVVVRIGNTRMVNCCVHAESIRLWVKFSCVEHIDCRIGAPCVAFPMPWEERR